MSIRSAWFVAFAVIVGLGANGKICAGESDGTAVKKAVADFHAALNTMFAGDADPMKAIWSHEEDITYMGPMGGFHVGWSEIEPIWDAQAKLRLGGEVGVADLNVAAGPKIGVASYYEKGENIVDGKPQPVSIRTTTTFRKEGGAWKVIGHHTDTLQFLGK